MTATINFLQDAYQQIDAGNWPYAAALLESLVSIEPQNIEAWEAYMQICQTCEELDELCEQVLRVPELNLADRESVLDYYYYLRQGLKHASQASFTFELTDQFIIPVREPATVGSEKMNGFSFFKRSLTGLLEKVIYFFYLCLLLIGLKLLAMELQFGYWVLLVLAGSILVNAWNMIFPKRLVRQRSMPPHPGEKHPVAMSSRAVT